MVQMVDKLLYKWYTYIRNKESEEIKNKEKSKNSYLVVFDE